MHNCFKIIKSLLPLISLYMFRTPPCPSSGAPPFLHLRPLVTLWLVSVVFSSTVMLLLMSNNITVLQYTTDTSHKVTRGRRCRNGGAPDDGHGGVRNMYSDISGNKDFMILKQLCISLGFCSILWGMMHGTMNVKNINGILIITQFALVSHRLRLKCDGTRSETRFRLSAKWTSPFKSAGAISSVDY
jgi:hypothetical protein